MVAAVGKSRDDREDGQSPEARRPYTPPKVEMIGTVIEVTLGSGVNGYQLDSAGVSLP